MLDGFDLDPYTILGVSRGAGPQEIRDAYREKSKKHHPDLGGDEWAFRIVAKAYEVLSGATGFQTVRTNFKEETFDSGRIRPGVHDKAVHPGRIVAVEMVWVRYEVEDVLTLMAEKSQQRSVSGALTLIWPDPALTEPVPRTIPTDRVLAALNASFDELKQKTTPDSARSHIDLGRFEAWLSYPNGHLAWGAFKVFHNGVKARGLGVRQWTRDLILPREERA
jgi:hypothetical protein